MSNRTAELAERIQLIAENHAVEIAALPRRGPNGGSNAAYIPGWASSPNGTVSKAAKLAQVPTMPQWSGHLPTPSTAIPGCIAQECRLAYESVFGEK